MNSAEFDNCRTNKHNTRNNTVYYNLLPLLLLIRAEHKIYPARRYFNSNSYQQGTFYLQPIWSRNNILNLQKMNNNNNKKKLFRMAWKKSFQNYEQLPCEGNICDTKMLIYTRGDLANKAWTKD